MFVWRWSRGFSSASPVSRRLIVLFVLVLAWLPGCESSREVPPTLASPDISGEVAENGAVVDPHGDGLDARPATDGGAEHGGAGRRPDVLLIIVDTLRADRLPLYGFRHGRTPVLNQLAQQGVVFDRALAASASTVPSHASLFTSRFVREHSVGFSNGGTVLGEEPTLAEQFRDAGYITAGFISNIMLNTLTGLARGFQIYDDRLPEAEKNRPDFFERDAPLTTRRAISFLEQVGDVPVFLLVHYQDPHGPYTPPDRVRKAVSVPAKKDEPELPFNETQSGFEGIPAYQVLEDLHRPSEYENRYVAEILYTDRWMGLLLDAFEKHRPDAEHVILFTSDHGESLGEEGHWFAHGHTSMPDLARIPMVLRAPGVEPGRRSELVSQVDVMPTLLEFAGLPIPEGLSGIALGPHLRGETPLPSRAIYMDLGVETGVYDAEGMTRVRFPNLAAGESGDTREALIERYTWGDGASLTRREGEMTLPVTVTEYLSNVTPSNEALAEPDEDQVERLRALGYIEPAGAGKDSVEPAGD